jgi:hypothetical protein
MARKFNCFDLFFRGTNPQIQKGASKWLSASGKRKPERNIPMTDNNGANFRSLPDFGSLPGSKGDTIFPEYKISFSGGL